MSDNQTPDHEAVAAEVPAEKQKLARQTLREFLTRLSDPIEVITLICSDPKYGFTAKRAAQVASSSTPVVSEDDISMLAGTLSRTIHEITAYAENQLTSGAKVLDSSITAKLNEAATELLSLPNIDSKLLDQLDLLAERHRNQFINNAREFRQDYSMSEPALVKPIKDDAVQKELGVRGLYTRIDLLKSILGNGASTAPVTAAEVESVIKLNNTISTNLKPADLLDEPPIGGAALKQENAALQAFVNKGTQLEAENITILERSLALYEAQLQWRKSNHLERVSAGLSHFLSQRKASSKDSEESINCPDKFFYKDEWHFRPAEGDFFPSLLSPKVWLSDPDKLSSAQDLKLWEAIADFNRVVRDRNRDIDSGKITGSKFDEYNPAANNTLFRKEFKENVKKRNHVGVLFLGMRPSEEFVAYARRFVTQAATIAGAVAFPAYYMPLTAIAATVGLAAGTAKGVSYGTDKLADYVKEKKPEIFKSSKFAEIIKPNGIIRKSAMLLGALGVTALIPGVTFGTAALILGTAAVGGTIGGGLVKSATSSLKNLGIIGGSALLGVSAYTGNATGLGFSNGLAAGVTAGAVAYGSAAAVRAVWNKSPGSMLLAGLAAVVLSSFGIRVIPLTKDLVRETAPNIEAVTRVVLDGPNKIRQVGLKDFVNSLTAAETAAPKRQPSWFERLLGAETAPTAPEKPTPAMEKAAGRVNLSQPAQGTAESQSPKEPSGSALERAAAKAQSEPKAENPPTEKDNSSALEKAAKKVDDKAPEAKPENEPSAMEKYLKKRTGDASTKIDDILKSGGDKAKSIASTAPKDSHRDEIGSREARNERFNASVIKT